MHRDSIAFNDDFIAGHEGFGMHPHKNGDYPSFPPGELYLTRILMDDVRQSVLEVCKSCLLVQDCFIVRWIGEMRQSIFIRYGSCHEKIISPRHEEGFLYHETWHTHCQSHQDLIMMLLINSDAVIYRGVFDEETTWTHMPHVGTEMSLSTSRNEVDLITGENSRSRRSGTYQWCFWNRFTFLLEQEVVVIDVV